MTLPKLIFATLLGFAAVAQGQYGPGEPQPYPGQPGLPYPGNPQPGYPYDPYQPFEPSRPGQRIRKEIYINRLVRAETLHLRRLMDLGRARGLKVNSVEVSLAAGRTSANLQLLIDRRIEDERSIYSEGYITLRPTYPLELGDDITSLQLRVNGEAYIRSIVVDLSEDSSWNPPGRDFVVSLPIPGYMPPNSRIDLTPSIDVNRFRGMTLVGVELTAAARYNAGLIEVQINSFNEGTVSLSPRLTTQVISLRQRLVVGQSLGSLVLAPRGEVLVSSVRLILRR